jgi:hypothetical protein
MGTPWGVPEPRKVNEKGHSFCKKGFVALADRADLAQISFAEK